VERLLKSSIAASIATAIVVALYFIGTLLPVVKGFLYFFTSMLLIFLNIAGLHIGQAKDGFVIPTMQSHLFLTAAVWVISFAIAAIVMPRGASSE
jgi:hypothetical protein